MKLFLLILISCISLQLVGGHSTDLNEYLYEKLRQSKIEFIKIHIQETAPVQEISYRIHWNKSWRAPITSDYQPFIIDMPDGMLILDSNRIMVPSFNVTWNETYNDALHQVYQINQEAVVKFVRSIIWKNTSYLLVCYETRLCDLYTAKANSALRFRHTIGYRGIPVDAKFFIQAEQLYLIMANNADKFSVSSVIYRWSGTYMDIVTYVMTAGVVSVTAFKYRQSTIIVFAQSNAESPWIGSEVYEFKQNNVVKIQFLSTTRPISVHHYVHGDFDFILIVNDEGLSGMFCWDGSELLDWFSLSNIAPHSLISIFHMDGDTFIVVAHDNIIELYKFHSTYDWKRENIKYFIDNRKIVDMAVLINKHIINVTLVFMEGNMYWIEQWEIEMTSMPIDNNVVDTDATRKCLLDLIETLQERMSAVKKAQSSWKFLLPSTKNLTILEPINFDSLTLLSGTINSIEIATEEDILSPSQIAKALDELELNVHDVQEKHSKWLQKIRKTTNMLEEFKEKIIANDVYLEELEIDQMQVDFVNNVDVKSKKIIQENEEYFAHPLQAESLIVHNLQVESLCGITPKYWTLRTDEGIASAMANRPIEYINDTVILHSDLKVAKLNIKRLNRIEIDRLINDLFIINHTQKINGTITYENFVEIVNLTTQMVNGVSVDKFMTTSTDQIFDSFHTESLNIQNLNALTVNGVPVEEAARKSRKNVVKGKLKLAQLFVTENVVFDMNESMIKVPDKQLQIYQNVTILGDLYVRNLKIDNAATLFVENILVNVNDMFDRYWTKSTDQAITKDITLEAGLTIDQLNTKYLNGFAENDFLYTTIEEIPSDFTNIHFKDFHVNQFVHKNDFNDNFFKVEPSSLTIREKLHIQTLRAKKIIALTFNGIDIDNIINETSVNFSEVTKLSTVEARRVFVDNFDVHLLNYRKVFFENGLHLDDDHQLRTLKVPEFRVQNIEVERLNKIEMNLTRLNDTLRSDLSEVIIDGDLTIENLTISQISGIRTESFLEGLSRSDIVITSERKIEDLIVENITLKSLYGQNLDDLMTSVLSKSQEQTVTGHISAHIVIADNITADYINNRNTSQLMWIDEPLTIKGNVTFTDLFVESNVNIPKVNGRNVNELYESLYYIPAKNINLLKVSENISWDTPSNSSVSISYLLNNTVTKDKDQIITGEVIFGKNVRAKAVKGNYKEIKQIQHIIMDAVLDDGELIEINGTKTFEEDVIVDDLMINDDLNIAKINDVNILEFNDSVVRQNREDTISGSLMFLSNITIEKLYVNNADVNASVNAAVRFTDIMPDNIFFEKLKVEGDVYLQNLDTVDFDKFVKNRVTITGDYNISCDMRFNGIVTVTGNADIEKINGICPTDFVLNDDDKMQMINGIKTFKEDLIVDGDVIVPRINNVDIMKEYDDGVRNTGEDVDIFGDLIFKSNIRIQNLTTSGLVNRVDLHSVAEDPKEKINKTLEIIEKQWKIIEGNLKYSSQISDTLCDVFFYLEEEKILEIPGTNVSQIDLVHFDESMIRLNMYSEQPGRFCGLSDNCSCTYQSVVDLTEFDNATRTVRKWQVNPGEIVKNFHDPSEMFGVNIMTTAVSSSKECTSTGTKPEYTIFSWMTLKDLKKNHEDVFHKVEGYLRDAKIFKHEGNVYVILAIYYDKVRMTHRTNSLLYRINDEHTTRSATLVQEIPTDGAWSMQIFKIEHQVFLLIGCFGEFSQSSLHRFNSTTQKFEQLLTFASKSRYVKSLSQGKNYFILLDNPDTNAVNIYKYDPESQSFYSYQSIFHTHQINGIECFYTSDFGNSDVYVIVTTQSGEFYIYEYMFAGKFQIKLQHAVNGLRTMIPFYYMGYHYILGGTDGNNVIFRIVKQGPH